MISIIIPVYNEEKFIKEILNKINNVKELDKEVIVVNDCSNDDTLNILKNECRHLFSKLVSNKKNMGKGFSVRQGIKHVNGEIIIIQDADLE